MTLMTPIPLPNEKSTPLVDQQLYAGDGVTYIYIAADNRLKVFANAIADVVPFDASLIASGTIASGRLPIATTIAIGAVKASPTVSVATDGTMHADPDPTRWVRNSSAPNPNQIALGWNGSRINAGVDATAVGDLAYVSDIPAPLGNTVVHSPGTHAITLSWDGTKLHAIVDVTEVPFYTPSSSSLWDGTSQIPIGSYVSTSYNDGNGFPGTAVDATQTPITLRAGGPNDPGGVLTVAYGTWRHMGRGGNIQTSIGFATYVRVL